MSACCFGQQLRGWLSSHLVSNATYRHLPAPNPHPSVAFPIRTYIKPTFARTRYIRSHRRQRGPYLSIFHIPTAASIRSLYRAILRTAARFPDDLVRWYAVAQCRDEWREHRAKHREMYQADMQTAYIKQQARLQVKERIQRIIAGASDEAATRAALALRFDPLPTTPLTQLHITRTTPHVSIPLRRSIHQRYKRAQRQLHRLNTALSEEEGEAVSNPSAAVLTARTRVLCAVYGWRGNRQLRHITHCRHLYFNAPHMLTPHTLAALHPLHRYLVTGVHPHNETLTTPTPHTRATAMCSGGAKRPAVGIYSYYPVERSDRTEGERLVCGSGWLEVYRLLIMERCRVLNAGWRRAYSDMLRQRQLIGAAGEVEQLGQFIDRKGWKSRREADERAEDHINDEEDEDMEDR